MKSVFRVLALLILLANAQTSSEEAMTSEEEIVALMDGLAEAEAAKEDEKWEEWEKTVNEIEDRKDLGEDEKFDEEIEMLDEMLDELDDEIDEMEVELAD